MLEPREATPRWSRGLLVVAGAELPFHAARPAPFDEDFDEDPDPDDDDDDDDVDDLDDEEE